jgi:hypothetical protein
MKTDIALTLPFVIIGLLFAGLTTFVFRPVLALVEASSSPGDISTSTDLAATSSDDITSATTTPVTSPPESTSSASETSAQSLTEVHIIGKKYVDYFTDGTTLTSYPGDPKIDSDLDQPNASIPAHEGLTWDHTATQFLYDTSSGDLNPGDYAQMSSGSYIAHYPATDYSDATSTVSLPDRITISPSIPTWDHLTPTTNDSSNAAPVAPETPTTHASSTDASGSDETSPQSTTDDSTTSDSAASSTSI